MNRHPTAGRPAALGRRPETGLAVVVQRGRHTSRRRPALTGVPAPLRHRAHLPHVETDAGWTCPKTRTPQAADRWTWLILTCYAQLYLARHLAADIRLPWQRPCPPGRLTPARVRRGFRSIRQALPDLAGAPKPGKPGPGRPPGSKNRHPAARHDVGKTVTRDQPSKKTRRHKG